MSLEDQIWDMKYRLKQPDGAPVDKSMADTWRRVANAAAAAERQDVREAWANRFFDAVSGFEFLPAGRILAGAGTGRRVTLFNCFVMGRIEDDLTSIFENVKEAALTMQQGGGIGHDFSTLRPKGAAVKSIGADSSGPVSFMDVWDAMCRTIMSAGARRGAMMATLRCDHPDVELFIDAKADPRRLRNFNVSVLVTDRFIDAVKNDGQWDLVFEGKTYKTVHARALWNRIMRATYDYAEPGVIFIDRINTENNLRYCEEIGATNPCGEEPLPPYGACLLGSLNLARLVKEPFTARAAIDQARLENLVATAVRFLDDVIDVSNYPLHMQKREAIAKRRIGLGVTGLADALIFCGQHYDSPSAVALAESWMAAIKKVAYLVSAELAGEKGAFELFDRNRFLEAPGVQALPDEVRAAIAAKGIRNGLLTSIAPTGTISLLAGNVSGGIEPVFDYKHERRILERDGSTRSELVENYAHALFRQKFGPKANLTKAFVTADELSPLAHLQMQAALQRHVDSSISKTINCPVSIDFDAFKHIYLTAYDLGLKGCTTYRPNTVTGAVLNRSIARPEGEPTRNEADVKAESSFDPIANSAVLNRGAAYNRDADVVRLSEPLERKGALAGFTYKLRWPGSDHAMYITINDVERDGRRRPFEVFINSKNLEHYAWTVALTRMISAIFRRGGDVSFVVEELKAVFDPQGGQWMNGRYVPSLLAAIGQVIEQHMIRTGFLVMQDANSNLNAPVKTLALPLSGILSETAGARSCPRCHNRSLHRREGCWDCSFCGYSDCR